MSRSVILVVIDCLRADHVSAMGYHRATTPALDRMADEGVLWEQAYSTSSWTKPSIGLDPCSCAITDGSVATSERATTRRMRVPVVFGMSVRAGAAVCRIYIIIGIYSANVISVSNYGTAFGVISNSLVNVWHTNSHMIQAHDSAVLILGDGHLNR